MTAIDQDADNPSHRLFEVSYEDGDVEVLDAGDIFPILAPFETAQVVFAFTLFCILCIY